MSEHVSLLDVEKGSLQQSTSCAAWVVGLTEVQHSLIICTPLGCNSSFSTWTDMAFTVLPIYQELIAADYKIWIYRCTYFSLLLQSRCSQLGNVVITNISVFLRYSEAVRARL